jgi:hypothetical protein
MLFFHQRWVQWCSGAGCILLGDVEWSCTTIYRAFFIAQNSLLFIYLVLGKTACDVHLSQAGTY